MEPVVGMIGTGNIARFHAKAFSELGTHVKIIADLRKQAAQSCLDRFSADFSTEYMDVINHPDVNVVTVFTPSPTHYPIVKAALEHGKHVICEKMLTLSADQSYELGELARHNDLILYTSYMKRFFPALQKAQELVPRLGHLMSLYARTYQGVGQDIHTGELTGMFAPDKDGLSSIQRMAGGGILVCGGSHLFDLILFLVGKPKSVYALRHERGSRNLDVMHHALLELPEGTVGHVEANWHPLTRIGYESRGWEEYIEISGVNGRIFVQTPVWNEPERNAATLRHYDNQTATWVDHVFDAMSPFVEAEKFFLAQIARGEQGTQDRYTGYRVEQLIESTTQSSVSGKPVEIVWRA